MSMRHVSSPSNEIASGGRSLKEILEPAPQRQSGLLAWWYRFTAPPALPENATYIQKERERRGRLLSTIALFLIILQALIVLGILPLKVPFLITSDTIALFVYCVALAINRQGKTTVAGLLLVCTLEFVLILTCFTFLPRDTPHLPIYGLFIAVELLAVSLLPARTVFVAAFVNSIYIALDLRFQPATPAFASYLAGQYYNALILPVSMQILVAAVTYLWVRSATQAIARADRAEVVARLEHIIASQKEAVEDQKRQLEAGIQQLIAAQAKAANGYIEERIPLPQSKALWPLAGSLNTLLARLRRSYQAEEELARVAQATSYLVQALQHAEWSRSPLRARRTGTVLDQIALTLNGKTITSVSPTLDQRRQD